MLRQTILKLKKIARRLLRTNPNKEQLKRSQKPAAILGRNDMGNVVPRRWSYGYLLGASVHATRRSLNAMRKNNKYTGETDAEITSRCRRPHIPKSTRN